MNSAILKINLNSEKAVEDDVDEKIFDTFLGGRGLGIKLFTGTVPKNINPLSKENVLIFSIGPLTGSVAPTSGRFSLVTKSPLTHTIFHSNSGGFWGPYFKKCGYDSLFITGKLSSENKGYLLIDGYDKIEIKDAENLWGLKTSETLEKIQKIEGKN